MKLKGERLYQQLAYGDKFVLLFYLLLNGDMFTNKTDSHIEEFEIEDSQQSETSKYVNKDSFASICETFQEKSPENKPEEFNTEPYENISYKDTYKGILKKFMKSSAESTNLPNLCVDANSRKLKGGGTEKFKLKTFNSKNQAINSILNALRSSSIFEPLNMVSDQKNQ